jgi:phage tail-like protein
MRGLVPGLLSPHPLGERLPGLFQEDEFAQRLVTAFDESLAPVFTTLDNLEAYLDPRLAPDDFAAWLAEWVGLVADDTWSDQRRRAFVLRAAEIYRIRGTARGLTEELELIFGGKVTIEDSGGVSWSQSAEAALPGTAEPNLKVKFAPGAGRRPPKDRFEAVVRAAKPAHMPHEVELATKAS